MQSVLMLVRVHRRALRAWVSLALLVALVGGAVLALGAGARRTDTAYQRFLQGNNASDVLVTGLYSSGPGSEDQQRQLLDRLARLPQVAQRSYGYYVLAAVATPSGRHLGFTDVSPEALEDAHFGNSVDRFKVLSGRPADPDRPDEATISFALADQVGLRVGDRLTLRPLRPQDVAAAQASGAANPDLFSWAKGAPRTLRITGIVASPFPGDFPPLPPRQGASLYLTPAFLRSHPEELAAFGAMAVKLRHGAADLADFELRGEALAGGQQISYVSTRDHEAVVQSSLHLEAQGIGLLAALGAAVLLLVLAQGLARRIALDSADHATLRALGTTRPQLFAAAMLRAALAGLVGAAGAVAVAAALSPLSPFGLAGIAEPHPGFDLDPAIVVGGAAALLLLLLLFSLLPAWQTGSASRQRPLRAPRASQLAGLLSRAAFPASAVAGVRLALETGRGRAAVPVRSAVTACALAAATVAAALAFTASLGHLLDTPRLYGWTWHAEVTGLLNASTAPRDIAALPSVAAVAQGTTGDVTVDSERVAGLAMQSVRGTVSPAVVSGRLPARDDEIVLGTQTDAAVPLGNRVTVRVGNRAARFQLVGRAVIPVLSDTSHLGVGAWLPFAGLNKLLGPDASPPDTFLVRFLPGQEAAGESALLRLYGSSGVTGPQRPTGLVSFGDVSALPLVLGGVLALGAVATLAHAVATSVRRRRHDLAVLKTLGFVRRQVRLAVAWQTSTIVLLAAVVGVPLGAAAGRWAWTLFADQQGLVAEPVLPLASVLLLLPAGLLVANLVAAIPGRYAARTSPALVLRTE